MNYRCKEIEKKINTFKLMFIKHKKGLNQVYMSLDSDPSDEWPIHWRDFTKLEVRMCSSNMSKDKYLKNIFLNK